MAQVYDAKANEKSNLHALTLPNYFLTAVGEFIERDEQIATVETDKVTH